MQVFLREDGSLDFDSEKRGEVVKMGSELWSRLNGVCVCTHTHLHTHTHVHMHIYTYLYIYKRGGGGNGVRAVEQTKQYTSC